MLDDAIDIVILGDFVPEGRSQDVIVAGDFNRLYNNILSVIRDADISITNLECPLVENGKPIAKTGARYKAPPQCVEAIKYAGFDMVTLANNHMMDYGEEGLLSTMRICENNQIKYIGVGRDISQAMQIQYFNRKGCEIAFLNCCENEWSTTTDDNAGCNLLDEVGLYYQISEAKKCADVVILIIHGGHELYDYPSPRMKKLYRWFVDIGVDAVVGHHTHCCSGYEIYKGKPIVYSIGNFIFDSDRRGSLWNEGAAAKLSIRNGNIELRLLPFTQCDESVGAYLLSCAKAEVWHERESKKSIQIQDDGFLVRNFKKFAAISERQYLSYLEPSTFKLIQVAKNRGLMPRRIRGAKRLLYKNIIRCEAHRDILLELL